MFLFEDHHPRPTPAPLQRSPPPPPRFQLGICALLLLFFLVGLWSRLMNQQTSKSISARKTSQMHNKQKTRATHGNSHVECEEIQGTLTPPGPDYVEGSSEASSHKSRRKSVTKKCNWDASCYLMTIFFNFFSFRTAF